VIAKEKKRIEEEDKERLDRLSDLLNDEESSGSDNEEEV